MEHMTPNKYTTFSKTHYQQILKIRQMKSVDVLMLNPLDITFKDNETSHLTLEEKDSLTKFLEGEKAIFGDITVSVKNIEHFIHWFT